MGSLHPSTDPLDVLIVGAGPVGLALALDLGRRGIRSTIVERGPDPDPASGGGGEQELLAKASVINERTMEFCRQQGIRDEVAHAGFPPDLPGDTIFCTGLGPQGKLIGRLAMPSARDRELPSQCCEMLQRCPQFLFDPVLARAVARQGMTHVRYGVELVGCEPDEDGVTCFVRHVGAHGDRTEKNSNYGGSSSRVEERHENENENGEEIIRARYLVACDGPASTVRKTLGIPFEGKDLGYTLSVIVKVDLGRYHFFPPGERYLFIGPEGTWANFTTLDGRSLWRFTVVGSGKKMDDPTRFDIHAVLRRAFGNRDDDVEYELMRVRQWRRSQFTAARYSAGGGRVFLAGDAAHTMSPTGGHGLNTGIGDVSDLSWMLQALLEGWGGPRLIPAYHAERRPVAIRNSASSTKNFALWTDRSGRDKLLDDGPEGDAQRRALGQRMADNMRQEFQALGLALGYNYADSPLVVPDGTAAPPDAPDVYIQTARPGHRAPHCWMRDGRSTLDLFGRGFVLLRFAGNDGDEIHRIAGAAEKVRLPLECVDLATEPEAAKLYERRLVLVRPDGMVAWRGDVLPEDVKGLVDRVRGAL